MYIELTVCSMIPNHGTWKKSKILFRKELIQEVAADRNGSVVLLKGNKLWTNVCESYDEIKRLLEGEK